MSSPSLASPPLPTHALLRPGLVRELDRACRRQLTLLVAPQGAGKTLLLRQWAAAHDHAVSWVRPAPGGSAGQFARQLVDGVDAVASGAGAAVAGLVDPNDDRLGRRFLQALAQAATALPPAVVVVDGLDALPDGVGAELVALADLLPPQVRLVIAARRRPVAPLHRLQARGELSDLGANLLRFDLDETSAVLAAALRAVPDPGHLAAVHRATDGLAAAVTLVAASLRLAADPGIVLAELAAAAAPGHDDDLSVTGSADGLSHRLWQHVSSALESEDVDLLAVLAQLDETPAGLIESLAPVATAIDRLDALAARAPELLVADLDRAAYHLHPMVIDRLRVEPSGAEIDLSPTLDATGLLRRAAGWHRDQGDALAAARLLHRAEAWPELVALIAEVGVGQSARSLSARWANTVSVPHLLARPADAAVVIGTLAWAGDLDGARFVSKLLCDVRPRPRWAATVADALELVGADLGHDPEGVQACCDRLEVAIRAGGDLLPPVPSGAFLAPATLTAMSALWRGRACFQQGRFDEALIAFAAARKTAEPTIAELAACEQALTLAWIGRLAAAEGTVGVDRDDASSEAALVRAVVSLARARLGAVEADVEGVRPGRVPGWPTAVAMWGAVLRAEALLLSGDLDGAAASLVWDLDDEPMGPLAALAAPSVAPSVLAPPVLADQRAALAARVQLARGQVSATRLALREGPNLVSGRLVAALLAIATRDLDSARRELQGLDGVTDRYRRERDVLLALLQQESGDDVAARQLLLDVAERSADDGDLRPFVLPGALGLPLLRRAAPADPTGLLDAAIACLDRRDGPGVRAQGVHPIVASLSRRELELLPLLPTHLTVSDIAERLYISTNTAKTHLRHIYRKLGVGNRRAAVARSTELGLIDGWRS